MRRLLRWLIGLASALAVWKLWSRRHREPEPVEPDPAEELRRKLAETRQDEQAPSEAEPAESLEERRARVHAQAQEAIDAMHEEER